MVDAQAERVLRLYCLHLLHQFLPLSLPTFSNASEEGREVRG